ncbi:response regulator [candidate division KSB1 bacterium]
MKEIFTIPEIAKLLDVSRHAVYKWVKKGYLTAFQPARNADWKVTRKELVRYIKDNNIPMEFLPENKIKILIVDDEKFVVRTIKMALSNSDQYQIESANSGFIAGAKLESFKPDLVILDIFLGDVDGREFFNHIRDHSELSKTKVIGISGKLANDEIKELLDKGFDDFISKPFKLDTLKNIVKEVTGK